MKQMLRGMRRGQAGLLAALVLLLLPGLAHAQQIAWEALTADAPMNLLTNGGFEAETPAYWTPEGEGATWSSEVSRTPSHSLQLAGEGEAAWTMDEAVRNWTPGFPGGGAPELVVGAYVRTEGVNTTPESDAEKFQLVFEFFDEAGGTNVLGEPLVLDVPQDAASTDGWVELSSETLGAIALTEQAAKSARVTFRKGADATGTVNVDDFFVRKADPEAEGWSGDLFNANVDAGDTWYYWWDCFSCGNEGWPESQPFIQTVTGEDAHTGTYSLRIEQNDPEASEAVAISERVAVEAGEPVLVSFWVRHEGHPEPDSIGRGQNNLGLTAQWFGQLESGAAGYGDIGTVDVTLNGQVNATEVTEAVVPHLVQEAETGWTQYALVLYPPAEAEGVELRPRYWHQFEGTTFWDDVSVVTLGGGSLVGTAIDDDPVAGEVPGRYLLHQNYPNPFNPTTTLRFDLPEADRATLEVYNILGQRVATLVNDALLQAGRHELQFDATNLASGTYLYVLRTANHVETRRMVLIK